MQFLGDGHEVPQLIGYEIAAGLGGLGYRVGVGAREGTRRETAVEKLRAVGVDAYGVPLDVTDDRSVTGAADLIERQAGRLDVLVNNAGISGEMDPGWAQDPTALDLEVLRTVVDTNVMGVVRVTNAIAVRPAVRRYGNPDRRRLPGPGRDRRQRLPGAPHS